MLVLTLDKEISSEHQTVDSANYWSDESLKDTTFSRETYWLAIPRVSERYAFRATGKADTPWHVHCLSFVPQEKRLRAHMLSLGCGFGSLERTLWALGAFADCDAVDVAHGAIASAREQAESEGCRGINYSVANINEIKLQEQTYDAVWFNMSLHHVDALEHVLVQVARSLKPDGLLFVNEYVGASRFAFPERQVVAMRSAFHLIPERYRVRCGHADGNLLEDLGVPNPRDVESTDPSESIRSAEIVPLITELFDIVEHRAIGGTLLQFVLNNIAGNFCEDDPNSVAVLEMLFKIEDTLIDTGALPSDFALFVARPKTS